MRHYHPDVQKGMEFDEISKEINEAYQILKDPFSRADYDHNLAQHRYYGGKRVSHRLGFIFLGSILFIAIIYMVITPSKTFIPSVSQPIRRNIIPPQIENKVSDVIVEAPRTQGPKHDPTQESVTRGRNDAEINHIDGKQVKVENNQANLTNQTNQTDQSNSINQPKVKAKVEVKNNQTNQINQTDQRNPVTQVKTEDKVKKNSINPIDPTNPINPSNSINPSNPSNPTNPITQAKAEAKPKDKVDLVKNQPNRVKPATQVEVKAEHKVQGNSVNPTDSINSTNQERAEVKAQKTPINPTNPSNPSSSRNPINPINQPKTKVAVKENSSNSINPSSSRNPLMAREEEEVKKFFANYVGQYNRKDLIGLMSFFSNRAIQNQKDRLEGIRKIYFTFFNQSLELKYRLSDLKIEICQNVVNVNAQYELDQLSRNGRRNAFRGSIQWVLAREGGELKIVSLHYQQTKGESHEI
jgi:curved DNA-binding protein CbpA/ketosteroid isomerase-like protein